MADLSELTTYVERSLFTPLLEADPAYIQLKTDLSDIVARLVWEKGFTVDTLPVSEERGIILEARKEAYMRLATSKAPEFDAETEFTKMLKSSRFDHYIKLAEMTQKEIDSFMPTFTSTTYLLSQRRYIK